MMSGTVSISQTITLFIMATFNRRVGQKSIPGARLRSRQRSDQLRCDTRPTAGALKLPESRLIADLLLSRYHLTRERRTHRVEIDTPRHRVEIAGLHSAYQH